MNSRTGSAMNNRPANMNMNSYPVRQAQRLQNTPKIGPNASWGGVNSAAAPIAGTMQQHPFGTLGGSARPGQLSGFAQVMGGGGTPGPIDMSDFPSLSGGPRAQQNTSSSATGGWNSSAIRQPVSHPQPTQSQPRAPSAAPSQQSIEQYENQRASQSASERSGNGEEFPPLNGQLNGEPGAPGYAGRTSSPEIASRQAAGHQTQLPIRQNPLGYQAGQQTAIGQSAPSRQPITENGQPPPTVTNVKPYADMTEDEKWGLPGLMAALEARKRVESGAQGDDTLPPAMRSSIIMGQELNDLGMNLESPEPLYPTFTPFPVPNKSPTPFNFHDQHVIPDFTLPSAYTVINVPPLSSRMGAFSDETLFSIFYQMPRDIAQELAAHELTAREWRWHKVLRQWLQKDTRESNTGSSLPLVDLAMGIPIGTPTSRLNDRTERGVYIFFEAQHWRRERREFVLDYDQLDVQRNLPASAAATMGPAGLASGSGPGPGIGMQNGAVGGAVQQPQQQTQID